MARTYARTFVWRFDQPPAAIWPALADTQRFNEAAGLPRQRISETTLDDGSVEFRAEARIGPFSLSWQEIPVEWVEGQWFRHLRLFENGPLASLDARFSIRPEGDGAVGDYEIVAQPRNLLGHLLLATGFFRSARRNFTRLAMQGAEWAAGRRDRVFGVPPAPPSEGRRAQVLELVRRLEESGNGHGLANRLVDWIWQAQEVDLQRIQPLLLAKRWQAEARDVVELCLGAVHVGLLEMRWDLLCPRCRGAKLAVQRLDQLPNIVHCASCNISYDRNFARNVELAFHPAPILRSVADGEFCLFGPMSTPHVKAQLRLAPGARVEQNGSFPPGAYRARTLEIGGESDFEHAGGGFPTCIAANGTVSLGAPAGEGRLGFENREERTRTLIVESRDWLAHALTAERVATLQCFRDLCTDQVLAPGEEADVSQVVLMFTDLKGSTALYERIGDAAAYRAVRRHFALLASEIRAHNGAVVKTIGDAVMAAFQNPADAVAAALAIRRTFAETSQAGDFTIRLGLHMGPCIAVTLNDRLDYFGSTVNMAARLEGQSQGGDIVFSEAVLADPDAAALLASMPLVTERASLRGFDQEVVYRRLPERP